MFYLFELIKKTISANWYSVSFIYFLSLLSHPPFLLSCSLTHSLMFCIEFISSFVYSFYGQHSPTLVILFLFTYLLTMCCPARIFCPYAHITRSLLRTKFMLSYCYTFRYITLMFYELSAITFTKTHKTFPTDVLFLLRRQCKLSRRYIFTCIL